MIAKDKKQHFMVGFGLALLFGLLFGYLIGFVAAVAFGVLKELYDMTGRGTPEWMDMWYTIAGGSFGIFTIVIIQGLV